MRVEAVILAAGKGTRMYSDLPKVLHALAGQPLLAHVLATARTLGAAALHVVYGHGGETVVQRFPDADAGWVLQAEQKGTGHALAQALPQVAADALVLVLYGDVPLVRAATLRDLLQAAGPDRLALLTMELPEAGAYGRIQRDGAGRVVRIVESKDAGPAELALREVNTGFLAAPRALLARWLAEVRPHNAQGEYYLTDIVALAVRDGITIVTRQAHNPWEVMGVNSKSELAELERVQQMNQAQALMQRGVTLCDPARFDLRGELECGRDVVLDVNVVIEGRVVLGDGVAIGPNNVIRDATIGAGTRVEPNCVIEAAQIGRDCRIGPFARIRPGSEIADGAHIGNFVEIKQSEIGPGSKVNHLTYVGDATVGRNVNIGAGTITCNYDGANKHRTVIGDDAFIGSNTALVAPVTVGAGATVGAGSTIARDVPPGELALTRAEQKTVAGWKRPQKKKI